MAKRNVVIGYLGVSLDAPLGPERWEKWRPSVALGGWDDFLVDRFELIYPEKSLELTERVRDDLATVSPETEVILTRMDVDDPWDFEEVYGRLHDFASNYPFDVDEERYFLHIATGTHVWQICLFLLAESKHFPAGLLQTSPPRRQRGRVHGSYRIIDLDLSRYDAIARRFANERAESVSYLKAGIETRNARFNHLIDRMEQVAVRSKEPLLLTGPTGAGKTRLAKRIYDLKKLRRQVDGRFVEVNCATLRGDGAMSTLFGHRRGAFTGAQSDRAGLLRSADGGLLFLDEIGELGLDEQAMLLRALEEGRFLPVGADREVESRFQLLAGTNRDLWASVSDGSFREDLLARIDLWTFELPGLKDRREDIEPNLDYELDQASRRIGTKITMNREARRSFLRFAMASDSVWSGNFRDLNAAVIRMSTLAEGGRISADDVDEEIVRLRRAWRHVTGSGGEDRRLLDEILGDEATAALDRFDRVQLADVLLVCRDAPSMAAAGRELFAQSRLRKSSTNDADRLRKYLARFGIEWKQAKQSLADHGP